MIDEKKRFFINIIRGFAVFLMLWGHCIQYCVAGSDIDFFENVVFKTIYSFHMPLFMLLSGYLFSFSFQKRSLKELIIHRTQTLVQPIVFCSFFIFLATDVLFGMFSGIYGLIFSAQWMEQLSSLWFLWSVLAASLVVAIVCKKVSNVGLQMLLLGLGIFAVAIFPNMTMNLYMYPYFIIGFYYAQNENRIPAWLKKLKYLSILIFPIMMCFFEKKHYIYTSGLINNGYPLTEHLMIDAYRWLIGLVGSIFVLIVLELGYKHIVLRMNKSMIAEGLSRLGQKSLQIYAVSVPLLSIYLARFFPQILKLLNMKNIFVQNMIMYNFVFTLGLAIVYAVLLYYFIRLLEKVKISKLMFGK